MCSCRQLNTLGNVAFLNCSTGSVMLVNPPQTSRLFIFSTIGSPVLIVSSLNASVNTSLLLSGISCSQNVSTMSSLLKGRLSTTFSLAVSLPVLAEFDDDGSGAYPGKSILSLRKNAPLWASFWDQTSATFESLDGVVQLIVVSHSVSGRDVYNPFLAYNDQSCSVDLVINGFNYSRFAPCTRLRTARQAS